MENFRATVHSSFFVHIGEDGKIYQTNEQGQTKKKLDPHQKQFLSTRYNSLQIKESNLRDSMRESIGNFSQVSLRKDPSKRTVNVNPLLVSQTRKNMSKTMLKIKQSSKK